MSEVPLYFQGEEVANPLEDGRREGQLGYGWLLVGWFVGWSGNWLHWQVGRQVGRYSEK
jgi:hypothetical protein